MTALVNLDYKEICNLIKKNTIGRIPVSNPNLKTDFDDELFDVLLEQLERVSTQYHLPTHTAQNLIAPY